MEQFELVSLKSGTKSLRMLSNKETFHPGVGPKVEATLLHVKQQNIVERAQLLSNQNKKFIIWDVGLGAAANALAAIDAIFEYPAKNSLQIEIHSFDQSLAALFFTIQNADQLAYPLRYLQILEELCQKKTVQLLPKVSWHLHLGDFRSTLYAPIPKPHTLFYDPYSPASNLEMWTLDHFRNLFNQVTQENPDTTLLTNYTRSTAVRVTLLLAGFYVGKGCLIGEKAETTLATNDLKILKEPLDQKWIERVRVSRNAAPLFLGRGKLAEISKSDLDQLLAHPQFNLL